MIVRSYTLGERLTPTRAVSKVIGDPASQHLDICLARLSEPSRGDNPGPGGRNNTMYVCE
jgi:hypothetical protein